MRTRDEVVCDAPPVSIVTSGLAGVMSGPKSWPLMGFEQIVNVTSAA